MSQTPNPQGQYFCEQCEARYDESGDCAKCPEEPLLNLLDEDVLLMLQQFDDARWQKRAGLLTMLSGVICAPLLLLVLFVKKIGFVIYGAAMLGLSGAMIKMFPPKRKTPDMGQHI